MKDMLGRGDVLSLEKAREMLLKSAHFRLPPEIETGIEDSLHRILSKDIVSPEDLPGFTRSTMDGYAVDSSDTFGASEGTPSYIKVIGEVFMGKSPDINVKKGESSKIATGGMLPNGTDAVVMFEHTNVIDEGLIEVLRPVAKKENTVQADEDCKKGDIVLQRGDKIRPQDIGMLAGIGMTKIWVYEKPVVSLITTGDEIVSPSQPLSPGQVRDINSYSLAGLVTTDGGVPIKKGLVNDSYEDLKRVVEDSLKETDIVVITGGSSVGTRDVTESVINSFGKPGVLFHGVSIKPGKPIIAGMVNEKPVFGLPGHPGAVIVCFELFVKPVLKRISGEHEKFSRQLRKTIKAKITKNIASSTGREDYIRVQLIERDGELWAVPLLGKSGLITTLVRADGTFVIPLRKTGIEQGTEVEVELF
jgi:molybdopterin molybdotransferase